MTDAITQADGRIRRLNSAQHMPNGKESVKYSTYVVSSDNAKYAHLYNLSSSNAITVVSNAVNRVHNAPEDLFTHIGQDVYAMTHSCMTKELLTNKKRIEDNYQNALIKYLKIFVEAGPLVDMADSAPLTDEVLFEAFTKTKEMGEKRDKFVEFVKEGDIERYKTLPVEVMGGGDSIGIHYDLYTASVTKFQQSKSLQEIANHNRTTIKGVVKALTELLDAQNGDQHLITERKAIVSAETSVSNDIRDALHEEHWVDKLTKYKDAELIKLEKSEEIYKEAEEKVLIAENDTKKILKEFKTAIAKRKKSLADRNSQSTSSGGAPSMSNSHESTDHHIDPTKSAQVAAQVAAEVAAQVVAKRSEESLWHVDASDLARHLLSM
jgi:hypothetical protein